MANSYKDIIITPNRANTADPKIEFRGANSSVNTAITVQTYPTSNGTLSFEGSAGQLFSITNDLTGSIFSVNDVSGIPSIEVFANGQINMAQYGGNVSIWGNTGIGTSSPYGIFQIENPTANNAAYKSILTITAHENTEGSTDGYNGTSASFGTTFRRNWDGGSYTDLAGIYAYAQNSWRGGLVFRTKSDTSSGGSPADRMVITPAGNVGISTSGPSGKFHIVGSGSSGLLIDYNNAGDNYYDATSAHHFRTNGYVSRMTINSSGSVASTGDMRAPIFYDTDNTNYYLDAANSGTSLTVAGNIFARDFTASRGDGTGVIYLNSAQTRYLFYNGATYEMPSAGLNVGGALGSGAITSSGTVTASGAGGFTSATYVSNARNPIWRFGNADGYGFSYFQNTAGYGGNADSIGFHFGTATAAGSILNVTPTGLRVNGRVDGTIFYDTDNTDYYVDPATGSNLAGQVTLTGGTAMSVGWNRSLLLNATFPTIVFGSGSTKWSGIGVDYSNAAAGMYFWVNGSSADISGTGALALGINTGNFVTAFGSMRSPLFYDTDNTSYYANPAGASVFNDMRALIYYDQNNTGYYMQPSIVSLFNDLRASIFYDRDNTAYYTNPASTSVMNVISGAQYETITPASYTAITSVTASTAPIRVPNRSVGGSAGFVPALSQLTTYSSGYVQHLVLGNYRTASAWGGGLFVGLGGNDSYPTEYFLMNLGGSISHSQGFVTTEGSSRAPIFYDSNNTSYYVDPNGNSRIWTLSTNVGNEAVGGANASNEGLVLRGNYDSNTWAHKFHKYDNGSAVPLYLSTTSSTSVWQARQGWGDGLTYTSQVFGSFGADSLYSPIFYDRDNTGYYVDPSSGSNVFGMFAINQNTNAGLRIISTTGLQSLWVRAGWNTDGSSTPIVSATNIQFQSSGNSAGTFSFVTGNTLAFTVIGDYAQGAGSLRAPIFYDSDNTAFYIDPNTSGAAIVVNGYMLGGLGAQSTSGTLDWNHSTNSRSGSTPTLLLGTDTNGPGGSIYYHPLNFEYSSKDGSGNISQLAIAYGSPGNSLRMRGKYDGTWSSWIEFLNSGGDSQTKSGVLQSNASLRAPIFYDSNDTAYYTDPASTSLMNIIQFATNSAQIAANQSSSYGSIVVRGSRGGWRGIHLEGGGNAPHLMFDGSSNGGIYFESSGRWAQYYGNTNDCWGIGTSSTDSPYSIYCAKGVFATSRLDAPIYYDSNNTGYYVDPNSTSRMNLINADTLRSYTDIYTDQNYGYGLVGLYSATRYQGVFAMGNSYKLPADGTTTGSLYGIAWSHPNAGGIAGNLSTHGALFLENGAFMAAISGSIRCRDDMRAPIYYDSNNTGHYVDPNGTSSFTSAYFFGSIGGLSNSSSYTEAAIELRERNFGGAQDDTRATAPRISFHWGGRVASQIAITSAGHIEIINDPGTGYESLACKSFGVGTAASGTAGEIRATNNITAYYSDRRLKENITPIENPIAKLMAISGVTFNSNDTAAEYGYIDKKRQVGVIAQEVAAVLPEIVVPAPFDIGQNTDGTEYSISGENYQTVQYEKLVPLLIEAFKAQQTLINSLQEQINSLKEDK